VSHQTKVRLRPNNIMQNYNLLPENAGDCECVFTLHRRLIKIHDRD
jgi:hypothetical protein